MFDTIVTWQRENTILQQHILVDIQDMKVREARDLQAQSPTDAFWVFTNYPYDYKKGDILINEANTSEIYRIFARVKKYSSHAEIPVELIPATAPKTILADQLKTLIGHMYRQPNGDDINGGPLSWKKYLTVPVEKDKSKNEGGKLEVALLNALARLGIPVLFGGDEQQGGPSTPVFDLVALGFFQERLPTAVLISCKRTKSQPNSGEMGVLSDESKKLKRLLPDWLVFGALVNLGEPTADEFNNRNDIRIWKSSHVQAILHARDTSFVEDLLWTPPDRWDETIENSWRNRYVAAHKDVLED